MYYVLHEFYVEIKLITLGTLYNQSMRIELGTQMYYF